MREFLCSPAGRGDEFLKRLQRRPLGSAVNAELLHLLQLVGVGEGSDKRFHLGAGYITLAAGGGHRDLPERQEVTISLRALLPANRGPPR